MLDSTGRVENYHRQHRHNQSGHPTKQRPRRDQRAFRCGSTRARRGRTKRKRSRVRFRLALARRSGARLHSRRFADLLPLSVPRPDRSVTGIISNFPHWMTSLLKIEPERPTGCDSLTIIPDQGRVHAFCNGNAMEHNLDEMCHARIVLASPARIQFRFYVAGRRVNIFLAPLARCGPYCTRRPAPRTGQ